MDKLFPREIMGSLVQWLDRPEAFAIKGPRQAGKTTLLRLLRDHLIGAGVDGKRIIFLDFEDRDLLARFSADPLAVVSSYLGGGGRQYFLMDEFQYVPDSGQKLKILIDRLPDVKFVVTGSSSLELAGGLGKYLVGRVFFFELLPLSFAEYLRAADERLFRLHAEQQQVIAAFFAGKPVSPGKDLFVAEFQRPFAEYLLHGGYPAVVKAADASTKEAVLRNIIEAYTSKDVIDFLRVADAFRYRALMKSLAFLVGGQVNYHELSSSAQTYYHDVKRMLSLLSETYILQLIPPFSRNRATELRKMPKAYFFDTGLRNALAGAFNRLDERPDAGALAENAAFLGLRRFNPSLRYWRTIAKAEVDFVLDIAGRIVPVEVKFQPFDGPAIARGMRSFLRTYKPDRALVLTKGYWNLRRIEGCAVLFAPLMYM